MSRIVLLTALALEPGEREIVLGDLAERGSSGSGALFDVVSLVVRRQLLIWTSWRPWFALFGIVGVSGFYLNRMLAGLGEGIFEQTTSWRHYGVHYNTGVTSFRDEVICMSCLGAAIFCWAAVNASLLRRLSGRAGWLTGLLFYFVVLESLTGWSGLSGAVVYRGNPLRWSAVRWLIPLNAESACVILFLFAIPAICGAAGRLPAMAPVSAICTVAAALLGGIHAHDLQTFSNGAFPAPSWSAILAPYALVSWPVLAPPRLFRFH